MERKVGAYTFTDEEVEDIFREKPKEKQIRYEQLSLFDDEEEKKTN